MRLVLVLLLSLTLFGCKDKNAAKKEGTKNTAKGEAQSIEGNEASAIGSLRVITTSQALFQQIGGTDSFGSLKELGEKNLIDKELASGTKDGYKFTLKSDSMTFTVTADPVEAGKTGTRYFFTDQSGQIRVEKDKTASASSPVLGQ